MRPIQSAVRAPALVSAIIAGTLLLAQSDRLPVRAQQLSTPAAPSATLIPAPAITMASADSNSPAVWELVGGRPRLHLFTSLGWPTRHAGAQLSALLRTGAITFEAGAPPHGVWLEAVVPDVDGTWYGYYHNELPAEVCDDTNRMIPRIGAARSSDFGVTWLDLGIILEAPAGWHDCSSTNRYFVGGVGDFSAILDHEQQDLYFFFSQYGDRERAQGVAIGRMAWADRDEPRGKMAVWWRGSTWAPTRRVGGMSGMTRYAYPAGVPIYPVADGWHDGNLVDAFWGPSVHWNTYLEQYVMLLNHAQDAEWRQEGVYIAYASTLDDPTTWSTPKRLIAGGRWYPQVIGTELGTGTDKIAGQRARFFTGGQSLYVIQFDR